MNSAATLKLTWQVISHHPSLWVRWVHAHLVRGRDFWTIPEPQSASWCWRYILRSRAKARLFAFHIIGNGTNTRLWLDRWHPLGVLEDRFPAALRYDSYLPREARVSNCIIQSAWQIPSHVIPHVRDIYEALDQVPIHSTHADKLVWSPSLDGEFSIKSTYHALREAKPKLAWTRLVWFKGRIPRHSFISWFALRSALKTRVKLFAWNVASSTTCLLCGVGEETEEHLFGSCSYGRQIWLQILAGLGYSRIPLDWIDEVDWCLAQFVGDLGVAKKLLFCAFIYHVWCERNNRLHGNAPVGWNSVLHMILQEVRVKVKFLDVVVDDTDRNQQLVSSLRLDVRVQHRLIRHCSWTRPDPNWALLNTDGSLQQNSAGYGAIIRDHRGEVLAAAAGSDDPSTITQHELQAVEMGLKLAAYY